MAKNAVRDDAYYSDDVMRGEGMEEMRAEWIAYLVDPSKLPAPRPPLTDDEVAAIMAKKQAAGPSGTSGKKAAPAPAQRPRHRVRFPKPQWTDATLARHGRLLVRGGAFDFAWPEMGLQTTRWADFVAAVDGGAHLPPGTFSDAACTMGTATDGSRGRRPLERQPLLRYDLAFYIPGAPVAPAPGQQAGGGYRTVREWLRLVQGHSEAWTAEAAADGGRKCVVGVLVNSPAGMR